MGHWSKKCECVLVAVQNSDMRSRATVVRGLLVSSQSNDCHYKSFAPFIKASVKIKFTSKLQM